jgi:ribulose-5-phosphate 4-epimerase/fuculose-1-phosphate aldolase
MVYSTTQSVDAEREARIQLAAIHRMIEHLGWGEGIYNHIAMRVPNEPDQFLIKPHALRYDEVTATNLVKVDCRGDVNESNGVNSVGFNTHAPIMRERRDVECSVHIHTVPIMAVAAMKGGLKMLNTQSVVFYQNLSYMDFTGIVESPNSQQDLLDALGQSKALILRNHGAVITGRSVEDAFATVQRLVVACEIQMQLQASGAEVVEISEAICAQTVEIFRRHDSGRGGDDWPAWLRLLDRIDPTYRN